MPGQEPPPSAERRLAAIMFTDMVGFSALSGRNERLALQLLEEHRQIVRPMLPPHSGREIKTMADGFLVEFASAVEAVRCALSIQRVLAARNATAPVDEHILLRIGIHLGDVVIRDADVLGNGVNIASRIEPLSEAGGLCVSEDVERQTRNVVPAKFVSLGTPALKNVEDKIEVFRVLPTEESVHAAHRPTSTGSLAVLPFTNMSTDPENEFFSDGLMEDILTRISKISSLKVISRTSAMPYKNTTKNLRTIGKELGVGHILEGSVRKAGERVRITAQLIDAASDEHLWAETYDRDLSDIFSVQSEVADQIAQALKAKVSPAERERIDRRPTRDLEAYQGYLLGRSFANRRTQEGLTNAIASFERAIELDPEFGEAYAGLADSYTWLAIFEFLPPHAAFPKARAAAERAVLADPGLAEAHASLGLIKFMYDWEWEAAERELKTAYALNPNYATGHHFYADFLKGMGRFEEALNQILEAQALDPLSLAISSGIGHVLYLSRNYDRAIEAYRHTLELDPNFIQARLWFGRPFMQKGMYAEAIEELKQAVSLSGGSTISLAVLAHAYASSGHHDQARAILEQLRDRAKDQYVPSYWIALIWVGLGDKSQALTWFETAYEERSSWLAWANVEPRFDSLRDEPRFQHVLANIGFRQS